MCVCLGGGDTHGECLTDFLNNTVWRWLVQYNSWLGWSLDMLQERERLKVYVHPRAFLRGEQETLTSRAYRRAQSRDSANVVIEYADDEEDGGGVWVGVMLKFVRICYLDDNGADMVRPLRFALIDFYKRGAKVKPIVDYDYGTVYRAIKGSFDDRYRSFPVPISSIRSKLIYTTEKEVRGDQLMYFVAYNHNSGVL